MKHFPKDLFLETSPFAELFEPLAVVWKAFEKLPMWLKNQPHNNDMGFVDPSAFIHPNSIIINSYIGRNTKIYEGVVIRDSVVGDETIIGHSSEVARSIILNQVSIPRFNYVGTSIIGNRSRLGGMVSCASRRFDSAPVSMDTLDAIVPTNRLKLGAIVGDDTIIGFGTHLNPGIIIGPRCFVSTFCDIRISIPADSQVIAKQKLQIIAKHHVHKSSNRLIHDKNSQVDIDKSLKKILREYNTSETKLTHTTDLRKELDIDSLSITLLCEDLENEFGVEIRDFEVTQENFQTYGGLKRFITRRLSIPE